jgi:NTP pyrophosphatase (non-canonical NTP hydrolase)
MKMDDYQKQALTTELMSRNGSVNANDPAFIAKLLGLVGEAGEVAEKFKKIIRDKQGEISTTDKDEIVKELGDVLWYISVMADYLGVRLETVAETNLSKLSDRASRGASRGSGDNR